MNATQNTMATREVYLTHVDTDGQKAIRSHLVWDFDKFLAARILECAKLNVEKKSNTACVLPATREEYLASIRK
jgi:hypothetical protein